MRWIQKGAPPGCLAALRKEMLRVERATGKPTQPADWSPGSCSDPIYKALHRDQFGLCGYCTQRIQPIGHRDHPPPIGNGGMRIEHMVTRDAEPTRMYDWDNLLGVCGGRTLTPLGKTEDHCDRMRGGQDLTLNPTRRVPDPAAAFTYRRCPDTGHLLMDGPASDIKHLNLNHPGLAQRRRDAENRIAKHLATAKKPVERRKLLERELVTATTPDSLGTLPEFAPVIERYIRKKLRSPDP